MAERGLEERADVRVPHVVAAPDFHVPQPFAGAFEPVRGVWQLDAVRELQVDVGALG